MHNEGQGWHYEPDRHALAARGFQTVGRDPKFRKIRYKIPFKVDTWFERDRASIIVEDANENIVAEWWDEEVQEMFEDGFFVSGHGAKALENSVLDYLTEMEVITEKQRYGDRYTMLEANRMLPSQKKRGLAFMKD